GPALIENAPVQPGFLADHAARFFNGALGAGGHVFDAQVFQHHGPEAVGDVPADLMMPIATDTGALGGQARGSADCLGASVGDMLAVRLRPAEPLEGGVSLFLAAL